MMEKLPKIVVTFTFDGDENTLRIDLLGRTSNAVIDEAVKVRTGVSISSKLKLHQRSNGIWEFYPKMIFDADFDRTEDLIGYVDKVTRGLEVALRRLGCKNIVIRNLSWAF